MASYYSRSILVKNMLLYSPLGPSHRIGNDLSTHQKDVECIKVLSSKPYVQSSSSNDM